MFWSTGPCWTHVRPVTWVPRSAVSASVPRVSDSDTSVPSPSASIDGIEVGTQVLASTSRPVSDLAEPVDRRASLSIRLARVSGVASMVRGTLGWEATASTRVASDLGRRGGQRGRGGVGRRRVHRHDPDHVELVHHRGRAGDEVGHEPGDRRRRCPLVRIVTATGYTPELTWSSLMSRPVGTEMWIAPDVSGRERVERDVAHRSGQDVARPAGGQRLASPIGCPDRVHVDVERGPGRAARRRGPGSSRSNGVPVSPRLSGTTRRRVAPDGLGPTPVADRRRRQVGVAPGVPPPRGERGPSGTAATAASRSRPPARRQPASDHGCRPRAPTGPGVGGGSRGARRAAGRGRSPAGC